ncbi:MAG: hypothetical protein GF365_01410|nr:hypothetical protein [Candidatus Buchananbacteria bacterium]
MSQYPQVKFIIDYKKDIKNALNFLSWHKNDPYYLEKFFPKHLHYILDKKFTQKEKAKILRAYTQKYFTDNKKEFTANLKKIKKSWQKIAPRYFKLMDKIFKDHKWPQGDYSAVASIYNMFPRHIEEKIFFFPIDRPHPEFVNKVIAHEMTHFIYFDYLKKHYNLTEDSKIKNKPDNYVWLVSEIFNHIIENWQPYNKILKNEKKRQPYFGNKKLIKKMQHNWQKKQDIDWLLDKWLK